MLLQFLKEWLTWAEVGGTGPEFSTAKGLCPSVCIWAVRKGCDDEESRRVRHRLYALFDTEYPKGHTVAQGAVNSIYLSAAKGSTTVKRVQNNAP